MTNLNKLIAMGPVSPDLAPNAAELLELAREVAGGVLRETGAHQVQRVVDEAADAA